MHRTTHTLRRRHATIFAKHITSSCAIPDALINAFIPQFNNSPVTNWHCDTVVSANENLISVSRTVETIANIIAWVNKVAPDHPGSISDHTQYNQQSLTVQF